MASSAEGSIYSTPEYLDVLCGVTGGRFKILVAERSSEVLGGIGVYEESARWGSCVWVSHRDLLHYNGFVLRPHETKYPSERTARHIAVFSALEEALARAGYCRLVIRNRSSLTDFRVFYNRGWGVFPTYTYYAPLHDLDGLWNSVEHNLRRLIQRCAREGIRWTEDDDFDAFFRMSQMTCERKGLNLYLPRPSFQRYFERLRSQGLCRLYHARLPDGRAISTQLVLLGPHPISHTVCAAADAEFRRIGATAFLRWKVFEDLARLGFAGNDLTGAILNPVSHFKSQLGAHLEATLVLRRPDAQISRVQHAVSDLRRLAQRAARAFVPRVQWGTSNGPRRVVPAER